MRRAIDILGCNGQFPQGAGVSGWRRPEGPSAEEETTTISVCEDTGDLATEFCPNVRTETLKKGEPKPPRCTLHTGPAEPARPADEGGVQVTICTASGLRATPQCPNTEVRTYAPGEAPTASCPLHRRGGEPSLPPEEHAPKTPEVPTPEPPRVPSVPDGGGGGAANPGD